MPSAVSLPIHSRKPTRIARLIRNGSPTANWLVAGRVGLRHEPADLRHLAPPVLRALTVKRRGTSRNGVAPSAASARMSASTVSR